MGNNISFYSNLQSGGNGEEETDDLINLIDKLDMIAAYFILTSDFLSLTKLHVKEYCDKLITLTSDLIDKNRANSEIDN